MVELFKMKVSINKSYPKPFQVTRIIFQRKLKTVKFGFCFDEHQRSYIMNTSTHAKVTYST